MCENGSDFDTVDPRVHVELERLNNATDEINKLEVDLNEARTRFRQLLCNSSARVEALRLKLGMCVERAKPYYEARYCANEALKQTQVAAMKYERANSAHSAAREMVYLAEQGLGGRTLDPAWQEMLNHATQRVNEAERDRGIAGGEHKIACFKHEAANSKVQTLQKELKRAIAKSSLNIRRSLMKMSSLVYQHELMLLPYYEMKAHFNNLLEHQKLKVQNLETQVSSAKLTYAEALRNLEQISDEIHQSRSRAQKVQQDTSAGHENSFNFVENNLTEEFRSLPSKMTNYVCPMQLQIDDVDGYKSIAIRNNISSPLSPSLSEKSEKAVNSSINQSQSSEWTEINLDVSSPEEDVPYKKLDSNDRPKLSKQLTLPNPQVENEYSSIKSKMKLDTSISNWISRSSAKQDGNNVHNSSRRQSLDNILGPTGEKVKEIFSHGMMMLNISSLTERRSSEPKSGLTDEKGKICGKKLPSPLEKTLTYLTAEEDNSDTESISSVDMLTEEQINSLMLDKDMEALCEQVLGTPISEVVSLPHSHDQSSHPTK